MKTKTAVAITMLSLGVVAVLLGISSNIEGWKNAIRYPYATLFVLAFVIIGVIVGWRFYDRFFKPIESKMKEKHGIDENVKMDKKRFIRIIIFMIIPAIIGILFVMLLLKR